MKKIEDILHSLEKHIKHMKEKGQEIPTFISEKLRALADLIDQDHA
jgi:hypothetical protein